MPLIITHKHLLSYLLRHTLLLLGGIFCFSATHAQFGKEEIQFEHLTTQEGLSQNIITAIAQDAKGFVWIGTEDGLNRYDGIRMETYRSEFGNSSSISDNWIRDILLDSKGRLWVATHNGLSKYNPSKNNFTQYFYDPNGTEEKQSIPTNFLITLAEYEGDIWIGSGDAGLIRFDPETETSIHYKASSKNPRSIPNNNIKSLFVDNSNILWVGTNNGLCRYDRRLDNFFTYKKGVRMGRQILNYEVRSIFEDSQGTIWIGTGEVGVNYFNPNRTSILNFQKDKNAPAILKEAGINSIFEDDTKTLWIGTTQGLAYRKAGESKFELIKSTAINPKSLNNNDISDFYEDASRMLWVGTRGGGVNVYDVHRKKFINYKHDYKNPNSLAKDVVRAVYEDGNGTIWVGLREGSLDKIDRKTSTVTHIEGNKSKPNALWGETVSAIYKDSRGDLWIGSWGDGLNRYNPQRKTFEHYTADGKDGSIGDDRIQAIIEDEIGDIWVATDGGFYQWLRSENRFITYRHNPSNTNSLSSNTVQGQAFAFDNDGYLWVGTYDGTVDRFDPRSKQFKHFTPSEHGLPGNGIISLANQNDVLWIGTDGGGLYRLNRYSELLKGYTTANGLPSNVIYAIKPDLQGQLWLSTKNGLSNFIPSQGKFKNYFDYHGLQSNVFYWGAAYTNAKGEMFFGGINGLTVFDPAKIEENPYIPPVYITDFRINNQKVGLGSDKDGRVLLTQHISETKKIELEYTDRFFSFRFAALNYSHPERNNYRYMMEGFDEDWRYTDAQNPVAPYTNLPQGDYTFKVMGANNDGVWNTTPTTITVVMTPPWWRTWWAQTLGIFSLVAFAYLYYLNRLRRLQKQKIELVAQVRARTAEILEKNHALEAQQAKIVKQNQRIQSSINYAQRIQKSLLPVKTQLEEAFRDYFVMLEPKNIVSGDFYWMTTYENKILVAAVDCTGHGVPGAFMSMVGLDLLKETVNMRGITDPAEVLKELHLGIRDALHQDENQSRDGMDMALCVFEHLENGNVKMEFAGAHNPVVYIENGEAHTIKGDRLGIGGHVMGKIERKYSKHERIFDKPTAVYIFSDGFQDQFGGDSEKGRKLMSKNFKRLLHKIYQKPMPEQEALLLEELQEWKGERDQTDDILVMGIRVHPKDWPA